MVRQSLPPTAIPRRGSRFPAGECESILHYTHAVCQLGRHQYTPIAMIFRSSVTLASRCVRALPVGMSTAVRRGTECLSDLPLTGSSWHPLANKVDVLLPTFDRRPFDGLVKGADHRPTPPP